MALTTKAHALEAVVLMQTALDEALALQEKIRRAEAAGRTIEVDLLQAKAATMTARLQTLSAEIDRTREAFMQDIHDVASATVEIMTRVAQLEGTPHGHNS